MADYRYNCDHRDTLNYGPSYNPVLDVIFNDDSGSETEPVTLAEAKNFCKIDVSEDDDLITELITAARQECEARSNIGFIQRSVTAIVNNGNGGIYLPYGPIGEVESVFNLETEVTDPDVQGVKWKQLMTRGERLTVNYTGGYATLPFKLKTALLQCIFYLYDERKRRENPYPPIYLETLQPLSRND